MPYSILEEDQLLVFKISGEMDLYAARDLKPELNKKTEESDKNFLIDLTEAEYLDSSALGLLVGVRKRVLSAHKKVVVAVQGNSIKKLFELSDLDQLFTIVDGVEEARRSLKGDG